jgi:predicted nucleic acid-binding protein
MGQKRKIFLDTNTVIYFLEGRKEVEILTDLKSFYYSFISEIELHSYTHDINEKSIISKFLKKGKRIDINNKIISLAIEIRRVNRLKVPDAIIVASAQSIGADLYTSDEEILKKINSIQVINLLESE